MREIILLGSVLLLPLPAEARLEKQEYCDGYTTIDMRVCADIRLINQKFALKRKLKKRTYKRWDEVTRTLCEKSYEPYREGTIYPLMLSKCSAELNEVLLDHLQGLGERN